MGFIHIIFGIYGGSADFDVIYVTDESLVLATISESEMSHPSITSETLALPTVTNGTVVVASVSSCALSLSTITSPALSLPTVTNGNLEPSNG
jgi:hypothetical protein